MTSRFQTLTLATCTSEQATTLEQVRMVENAISLLFDAQMQSEVVPTDASIEPRHVWRMAVVDVHLPSATRRPFVIYVKAFISALNGHALVRISADGRTTSRQVLADADAKCGELTVSLHIRRSPRARDRLRLHLWTEASANTDNGQAQATVAAVDVLAR